MPKRVSKVYLVGAGPGDPRLLTLRGEECLRQADCILYDALVPRSLLDCGSARAKRIFVGKRGGRFATPQKKIEAMMIRYARMGKKVVRLKGGDPYLFGRGAEEVLRLAEAGIPFEVVPGVTSAIAVPSYAGIPLTHRHLSSSVAIVTGTEDPAKSDSRLHWGSLAKGLDTLVFLMGVTHLSKIVQHLVGAGKPRQTPCALIQWGTSAAQKTVVGTLSNIKRKAKEENIEPPSIFIVGEVVRLRTKLNWFEKKPLFGKRILVTRAQHQIPEFRALLEGEGAEVLEYPMISIKRLDPPRFREKLLSHRYDWVIFTSVNGVEQFFHQLKRSHLDIRSLGSAKTCAIGPKTARKLQEAQLRIDLVPEDEFRAEAILEAFGRFPLKGKRILLIRAKEARSVLPDGLSQRGAQVENIVIYRTEPVRYPKGVIHNLKQEILAKKIDAVVFTSSSSVLNFVRVFKKELLKKIAKRTKIASIGPITSGTIRKLRLPIHIEAKQYTIEGLTQSLIKVL